MSTEQAESPTKRLLDAYTPAQLRQVARSNGIRIKQPNGNRVPIGAICEQLTERGLL